MSLYLLKSLMLSRKSPPLPYDYEVEYIQRIFPATVAADNTTGFDLSQYAPTGQRKDLAGILECSLDFYTPFAGQGARFGVAENAVHITGTAAASWTGFCLTSTVQTARGYLFGAISTGKSKDFDGHFVDCVLTCTPGQGVFTADGVTLGTKTGVTSTSPISEDFLVFYTPSGSHARREGSWIKIKALKWRDIVDLVPVVKGQQCGFYNKADGAIFLRDIDTEYVAGPRVLPD